MGRNRVKDSRPKVCFIGATLGNNYSRGTIMDYKVQLNHQEDENAPRGTRYYVEFFKPNDWETFVGGGEGFTWQEAMANAIDKLQENGEI
jgi:Na+-transporting NADH:ubiquinone oxidoreductase subunit NqrF